MSVAIALLAMTGALYWLSKEWRNSPLHADIDQACQNAKQRKLSLAELNQLQVDLRLLAEQSRQQLSGNSKYHAKLHRARFRIERKLHDNLSQIVPGG